MLPIAEYTSNTSEHWSTKISPFYTHFGYKPRMNWPTEILSRNPAQELYSQYWKEVFA